MRPTLVMRSLAGVAVIAIAALSYWIGVQRLHASRAEAAVPHSGQQAVAQSGLPDGKGAADARAGHRSDRTAAKPPRPMKHQKIEFYRHPAGGWGALKS
ncbi:hypothetical protein ACQCRM_26215, partial [Ralstonia pseudosolanacearum]